MFGSNVLDVAIGMIFVYLLLSLICSAVNEIIEAWLKKRATDLERGIRELLNDPTGGGLVKELYKHHLVSGLFRGTYDPQKIDAKRDRYQVQGLLTNKDSAHLPSYIPARNFALALMDVFLPAAQNSNSGTAGATAPAPKPAAPGGTALSPPQANPLQALRDAISSNTVATPAVKGALLSLVDAAGNDANKARENIEKWFDSSMDRVSGLYKRRSQVIILFLGLVVTVFANADTIAISKSLANDPSIRQSLVAAAQEYAKANPVPTPGGAPAPAPSPDPTSPHKACQKDANSPECRVAMNLDQLKEFGLPIGWDRSNEKVVPRDIPSWALKFLGWLVTAAAISLGAPFWFDLLNKFMIVRSTVKPHEKSKEEKSIG